MASSRTGLAARIENLSVLVGTQCSLKKCDVGEGIPLELARQSMEKAEGLRSNPRVKWLPFLLSSRRANEVANQFEALASTAAGCYKTRRCESLEPCYTMTKSCLSGIESQFNELKESVEARKPSLLSRLKAWVKRDRTRCPSPALQPIPPSAVKQITQMAKVLDQGEEKAKPALTPLQPIVEAPIVAQSPVIDDDANCQIVRSLCVTAKTNDSLAALEYSRSPLADMNLSLEDIAKNCKERSVNSDSKCLSHLVDYYANTVHSTSEKFKKIISEPLQAIFKYDEAEEGQEAAKDLTQTMRQHEFQLHYPNILDRMKGSKGFFDSSILNLEVREYQDDKNKKVSELIFPENAALDLASRAALQFEKGKKDVYTAVVGIKGHYVTIVLTKRGSLHVVDSLISTSGGTKIKTAIEKTLPNELNKLGIKSGIGKSLIHFDKEINLVAYGQQRGDNNCLIFTTLNGFQIAKEANLKNPLIGAEKVNRALSDSKFRSYKQIWDISQREPQAMPTYASDTERPYQVFADDFRHETNALRDELMLSD